MSEEVVFQYFLNGEKVDREMIPWGKDHTIKVLDSTVYVTTTTFSEGYLATRHKAPPGGFVNKTKKEEEDGNE
jgi:hypothetical protein